jgi:hypothetical protein
MLLLPLLLVTLKLTLYSPGSRPWLKRDFSGPPVTTLRKAPSLGEVMAQVYFTMRMPRSGRDSLPSKLILLGPPGLPLLLGSTWPGRGATMTAAGISRSTNQAATLAADSFTGPRLLRLLATAAVRSCSCCWGRACATTTGCAAAAVCDCLLLLAAAAVLRDFCTADSS